MLTSLTDTTQDFYYVIDPTDYLKKENLFWFQ